MIGPSWPPARDGQSAVGAANRAYAYFFCQAGNLRRMTMEARERLETIAHETESGARYGISMRDLELRGAGDIIGTR